MMVILDDSQLIPEKRTLINFMRKPAILLLLGFGIGVLVFYFVIRGGISCSCSCPLNLAANLSTFGGVTP
jgi:polyferredoxin